jgi:hypothetical protein
MARSVKDLYGITIVVPASAKKTEYRINNFCVRTAAVPKIRKPRQLSWNQPLQNAEKYDYKRQISQCENDKFTVMNVTNSYLLVYSSHTSHQFTFCKMS